jgi:hypothetical protein
LLISDETPFSGNGVATGLVNADSSACACCELLRSERVLFTRVVCVCLV